MTGQARRIRRHLGAAMRRLVVSGRIARARTKRAFGWPQGWDGSAPRPDLPALQSFQGITVVPGQSTIDNGFIAVGGPIWPDFERQTTVRFNRQGSPIDQCPSLPSQPATPIADPVIWGGFAFQHFGHFTAEVLGRVLLSIRQRPNDTVLFFGLPGIGIQHYPGYFWELLDWCGLPADRVRIVTEPLLCAQLQVMPEPEQLNFLPPLAGYLSLLDENTARNRLIPILSDRLYVARSRMLSLCGGCHAAESYLIDLLKQSGFAILYPETQSLRDQLAIYAGAKVIVFAEGSAIHGRQLLGWLDQQIVILNRRKANQMALHALTSRCHALTYCEATQLLLTPVCASSVNMSAIGLSIYDREAVLTSFARIGVDLAPLWDNAAYTAQLKSDFLSWFAMIRNRPEPIDMAATVAQIQLDLAGIGLTDIA